MPYFPFCHIIDNTSSPQRGIKRPSARVSPEATEVTPRLTQLSVGPRGQPALLQSNPGLGTLLEQVVGRQRSMIPQKIHIGLDPR